MPRQKILWHSSLGEVFLNIPSYRTAPTINRFDSVALALSSADSGPQKAGFLVQSWSRIIAAPR
jgi:hypothetical protein